MKGYVYVLTNQAMPGFVKVGRTTRNPDQRAEELFSSGVPSPFVVRHYVFAPDCIACEAAAHKELAKFRVESNREFFMCDVAVAELAVNNAHMEIVESFLDEFLPDHIAVDSSEYFDISSIVEACDQVGILWPDIPSVLAFLGPDEMRVARSRWLNFLIKKKESKSEH